MHTMDGRHQDIVPGERIVFTYDMHLDGYDEPGGAKMRARP